MTSSTTTVLFIPNPHTAEHHSKNKDKYVYLSYEEKTFVKKAVKISPMQSTGDLLRNVQDANDAIDFSLKKSIQYHVRKEQCGIRAYLLDDVGVDDILESLSRLSDKIWFKKALDQHNAGQHGHFQGLLHRPTIHDGRSRTVTGSHDFVLQCLELTQLLEICIPRLQHADCNGRHPQMLQGCVEQHPAVVQAMLNR